MIGCVTCSGRPFYVPHRDVRILYQREGSQLTIPFQQLPDRNDPHKYAPLFVWWRRYFWRRSSSAIFAIRSLKLLSLSAFKNDSQQSSNLATSVSWYEVDDDRPERRGSLSLVQYEGKLIKMVGWVSFFKRLLINFVDSLFLFRLLL